MTATTQQKTHKGELKRFELLVGVHEEAHPTETWTNPRNEVVPKTVIYTAPRPGQSDPPTVIETHQDLDRLNGPEGMAPKFKRVYEVAAPKTVVKRVLVDLNALSKKSNKELVEFAEDNEIDLEGATDQKDVLARIKAAMGAV